MNYKNIPISELIEKVDSGQIRLPEMQRGYVWKARQVSELLDSLYRGYPSGTILTWEAGSGIPTRNFAVEQARSVRTASSDGNFELLLDGQQRLTSLLAMLKGRWVRVRDKDSRIDILFNLRHPDTPEMDEDVQDEDDLTNVMGISIYSKMTFATSRLFLNKNKYWISVAEFFQNPDIEQLLEDKGLDSSDILIHRYRERLEKLKNIVNYEYRVDTLKGTTSYGEVTEIFVRVNSQGTKLRGSDLALAQITAKWPGSLKRFEEFAEECNHHGFDFDLGIYVKNLVVFATGQCKFETIGRIPEQTFKDSWENAKESMQFALSFLKDNVELDSSSLLSSPFLAIVTAYYAHKKNYKLSDGESKKLKRWILLANIKGRYSRGSSENFLDKDLSFIKKDVSSVTQRLIEDLEIQAGRLNVIADDLKDKKTNSPYFKTMFMAFRALGAKDWYGRTKISPNSSGKQKFEFHHIFPKKILKEKYSTELINDIANFAFITARTNKYLGGKEPIEYVQSIDDYEDLFRKQCIPHKTHFLSPEKYKYFLKERRVLIAARLNEFLETN